MTPKQFIKKLKKQKNKKIEIIDNIIDNAINDIDKAELAAIDKWNKLGDYDSDREETKVSDKGRSKDRKRVQKARLEETSKGRSKSCKVLQKTTKKTVKQI
jgi:hypothetical protein